jgi:GDSL-like Lipase/Acylhydrolase family
MPKTQMLSTPKNPCFYLPDGWDTGWKAAKVACLTSPRWLTVVGDSICNGYNSSDPMTKGWERIVRNQLAAQYPLYGDFWSIANSFLGNNAVSPPTAHPFTTGGAESIYSGAGYGTCFNTNGTGILTFITPYACQSLDIHSFPGFAGTWTYTVDGGGGNVITNNQSQAITRTQIRSLANTTHTIVITGGVALIAGIFTYNSLTSGLGFCNQSMQASQSTFITGNDTTIQALAGMDNNAYAKGTLGAPALPHLLVLAYGINDLIHANPLPNQFEWVWDNLIQAIRWGNPTCSILMLIPNAGRPYSDQPVDFMTAQTDWNGYKQAIYRLAYNNQCAVADIDSRWGRNAFSRGFVNSGDAHPNDAGFADMAVAIGSIL